MTQMIMAQCPISTATEFQIILSASACQKKHSRKNRTKQSYGVCQVPQGHYNNDSVSILVLEISQCKVRNKKNVECGGEREWRN